MAPPAAAVEAPIITVAGVDYVLSSYLKTGAKHKHDLVKDKPHTPPVANHDQWPEEIVIRQDGGGELSYLRADLIDSDDDGAESVRTKRDAVNRALSAAE